MIYFYVTKRIKVKIDSNSDEFSKRNTEFDMNVYPSTTIRELRTTVNMTNKCCLLLFCLFKDFVFFLKFKLTDIGSSSNQYLFVNGHLAHDTSTMSALNIQDGTLFILFIISTANK